MAGNMTVPACSYVVEGAVPSAAWGLARQAMELALQRGRQAGQIKALEEAERLQQALFQIADLAGADPGDVGDAASRARRAWR